MRLYLIHETCFYTGVEWETPRRKAMSKWWCAPVRVGRVERVLTTFQLVNASSAVRSLYIRLRALCGRYRIRLENEFRYGNRECKGGRKISLRYSEQAHDDSRLSFSTRLQDTTENKRERRTRASTASATHTLSNKPAEEDHAAVAVTANVYQLRVTFFRERRRGLCPAFWRYSPCSYL